MYENGKQVNRYAAMLYHKDMLKRRHTPINYASYESYFEDHDFFEKWLDYIWSEPKYDTPYHEEWKARLNKKRASGYKMFYQKWWQPAPDREPHAWKRERKDKLHRDIRNYYRNFIKEAITYEDFDDFDKAYCDTFPGDDYWD